MEEPRLGMNESNKGWRDLAAIPLSQVMPMPTLEPTECHSQFTQPYTKLCPGWMHLELDSSSQQLHAQALPSSSIMVSAPSPQKDKHFPLQTQLSVAIYTEWEPRWKSLCYTTQLFIPHLTSTTRGDSFLSSSPSSSPLSTADPQEGHRQLPAMGSGWEHERWEQGTLWH